MSGSSEHRRALWQRRLEANWDWLVENLKDLSSLSGHLISALVFSRHDADFVKRGGSDTTQRECNRRFLTRLLEKGMYWAIQQSWFARVSALCNLSCKKSREVAAHFRADF